MDILGQMCLSGAVRKMFWYAILAYTLTKKKQCLILDPYIKTEPEDTDKGGFPQLSALFFGRGDWNCLPMLRELSLQINYSRVFFNERPNLVTKSTLEGKKFYSYYCREIIFYFSAKATLVLSIPCTLCKDETNNSNNKKPCLMFENQWQ